MTLYTCIPGTFCTMLKLYNNDFQYLRHTTLSEITGIFPTE
jgi:hypothetical protein